MDLSFLTKELQKEKINSFLILQNGKNVFSYYKNKKQSNKLHKMNSCTKSVMSLLIGIALDKNFLQSIQTPVHQFFPKIFASQTDGRKMELTLYHLITMTDGLDFPEFGEWESFAPMVFHHDIVQFVIDRPMIHTPGSHMNYNSGCSHILSAILQQATGVKTEDFAREHLFNPLEIKEYRWYQDRMKINKGADGLVLKAEDMIKLGQLMLQNGIYNGERVVSENWIRSSTAPNLVTYENIGHYGMHWWVNRLNKTRHFSKENNYYFALGFGGQYIIVVPTRNMVIAVTSDIYADSLRPMRIIRENLLNHRQLGLYD
ncbi:serine hydrolase domain-containing protein [Peribacillus deserti]|uniref:serine hydrolase domain-containing protein n=1 Tax=Peribacillus deserti TaxID=673318 RepID=UPI0015E14700|nr:serine hydrolase [Peribacillus deserti]